MFASNSTGKKKRAPNPLNVTPHIYIIGKQNPRRRKKKKRGKEEERRNRPM